MRGKTSQLSHHSHDKNTPYYEMSSAGNNSNSDINNSQNSCTAQRGSYNTLRGENYSRNNNKSSQFLQNKKNQSSDTRNQRQSQQQQIGFSSYQQNDNFSNSMQQNSTDAANINDPSVATELLVKNLDQTIDPVLMKFMLESKFMHYVKVLNVSIFAQTNGYYAANVTVASLKDAQYVISKLYGHRIGDKKIIISYSSYASFELNHHQIKSNIISLLKEVPDNKLPLFEFREMFKKRFFMYVSIFDFYKMNDVCTISQDHINPIISLNSNSENIPSSFSITPEIDQMDLPYCKIHTSWTDEDWNDKKKIPLPNVMMSLQVLEIRINQLLKLHNGSLPLVSVVSCYSAEFHEPIYDNENGVPLEHLILCLPSFAIRILRHTRNIKFIVWSNNRMIDDDKYEPVINTKIKDHLKDLSCEFMDLLQSSPRCQLLLESFTAAYNNYFGKQCRLSTFGVMKLIDLLDKFKEIIQVIDYGHKTIVTLTHKAQVDRFTSNLLCILESQPNKEITFSEFPSAYKEKFGRPWNIIDYGVCQIKDLLNDISDTNVVVTINNDNNNSITLSKREETPEQIDKIKELSTQVVELLGLTPQCNMLLNEFTSSYYQHFSREFRVDDYGFTTLIELFEAIPDVVNIEDTNDGKKIINLTEKEKWNSLKKQVVELIAKTNGGIYVPELPHTILHDYKYMISPKKFSFKSVFIY